jgi:hypothetical protein
MPSCEYDFFDDNDIIVYINKYYLEYINIYNNIYAGAYKADLFRLLYAYDNGGIYFDCKQILFVKESYLFNHDFIFVEDIENNGIYNAFFIINKGNKILYDIIINCINNLGKTLYLDNPLCISGPQLWNKYIRKEECILKNELYEPNTHYEMRNRFLNSYIKEKNNGNILIKNSYYGYYDENNYLLTLHYSNLWKLKKVYFNHF